MVTRTHWSTRRDHEGHDRASSRSVPAPLLLGVWILLIAAVSIALALL